VQIGTARVFRQRFTLEDAIGSHTCSLEANMRVANSIHLGCFTPFTSWHRKFRSNTKGLFCGVGDVDLLRNFNYPEDQVPEIIGADAHDLNPDAQGFVLIPTILHPRSRGSVRLASSDPFEQPLINPNYLSDQRDVKTLVAAARHAVGLVTNSKSPLADIVSYMPTPPVLNEHIDAGINVMDDEVLLEQLVRGLAATIYHPTSTCRIGDVVDTELRVLGIENLRVIDASVMPHLPSANTNAPTIMVAEKGCAMMVAEHGLNPTVITTGPKQGGRGAVLKRVLPAVVTVGVAVMAVWAAWGAYGNK
jgi:hypothetical protein